MLVKCEGEELEESIDRKQKVVVDHRVAVDAALNLREDTTECEEDKAVVVTVIQMGDKSACSLKLAVELSRPKNSAVDALFALKSLAGSFVNKDFELRIVLSQSLKTIADNVDHRLEKESLMIFDLVLIVRLDSLLYTWPSNK